MKKPTVRREELNESALVIEKKTFAELLYIKNAELDEIYLEKLDVDKCIVESASALRTKIGEALFTDSFFEKCSFLGAEFQKSYFKRTQFKGGRFQSSAPECHMNDVLFESTKLTDASFRFGILKDVLFKDCELVGCDFSGATLERVSFENCNLTKASLIRSKLKDVNVSTSIIDDVAIDKDSILKVVISTAQALYLVSVFGLVIQD